MNSFFERSSKVAGALLAVAVLAACGTKLGDGVKGSLAAPLPPLPPMCSAAKECLVKVFVDSCSVPGGIHVEPNELLTPDPVSGTENPHVITWQIQDNVHVFLKDGIQVTDPGDQFEKVAVVTDAESATAPGDRYKLKFKNSKPSPGTRGYKYAVLLAVKGGVNCVAYDPFIKNQN